MEGFRQYLEITKKVADDVLSYSDILPFDNIFNGKYRIALPFSNDPLKRYAANIAQEIEALKDPGGKSKGYKVDIPKGIVTQSGVSREGRPFKRDIRLGAVIQRDLGQAEKDFWNRHSESLQSPKFWDNEYVIIISRHPIDIVRMSDHDWHSCHSPDDTYFRCAVAEAKGHGPIAYLVKTNDFEKIKNKLEGKEEIFTDEERKIPGIIPLARLRLRRFYNKEKKYELAIPEDRVYSRYSAEFVSEAFKEAVLKWAIKAQKGVWGKKLPKMADFVRTGGSYADTGAATLFNDFFQTDKYGGNVKYEGEDDYTTLIDQYIEEIRIIDNEKNNFKHPIWADASVEQMDGDGEPYVSCNGGARFDFQEQRKNKMPHWNDEEREKYFKIIKSIEQALRNEGYSSHDINAEDNSKGLFVYVNIEDDGNEMGPDRYKTFLFWLEDWDEHYVSLHAAVRDVLESYDILYPRYDIQNIEKTKYQNFTVAQDPKTKLMSAIATPILLGKQNKNEPSFHYAGTYSPPEDLDDIKKEDNFKRFEFIFLGNLKKYIKYYNELEKKQMMLPKFRRPAGYALTPAIKPEIEFKEDVDDNAYLIIKFNFSSINSRDQLKKTARYVEFMDKYFNQIVQEARNVFNNLIVMPNIAAVHKATADAAAGNFGGSVGAGHTIP